VDDVDDEEKFEEPIAKFSTIANMEDIKRSFFSGDYELFEKLMSENRYIKVDIS